jgi:hypothetical protein
VRFGKEEKPSIKFVCTIPGFETIEEIQPKPAVRYLPDWWKQIPIKNDGGYTSKICPSMSDYLSNGYILPMWMDMTFKYSKESNIWSSKHSPEPFLPLTTHGNSQLIDYADVAFIGKDSSAIFKANSPWKIITPKGYSVLQLPLLYHFNKDFTVLPGIIDTDTYHDINVQMSYHGNEEEIFIKRGTPLCVYIPFKRTKYNFSFNAETEKEKKIFDALRYDIYTKFEGSGWYRSLQRKRDDKE